LSFSTLLDGFDNNEKLAVRLKTRADDKISIKNSDSASFFGYVKIF